MARNHLPRLALRGSRGSCKSCGTFQNEIGALRMKGERLLAADIPHGLDGAKVALQQERSDWQAHSDQATWAAIGRLVVPDDGSSRAPTLTVRASLIAIALMLIVGSLGYAQAPTPPPAPEAPVFRVQVWGYIAADFSARIWRYSELRSELEKGLPGLKVTEDPREIRRAQRALAKRIRVARDGARQGDIFTAAIGVEFREVLRLEMDADTWAAIMDDNPGEFSNRINGTYPGKRPLSTVPPNILARLPRLPEDIQYRFVGRHLVLLDTRANLILDRIPYAIRCADCDTQPLERRVTLKGQKCRGRQFR